MHPTLICGGGTIKQSHFMDSKHISRSTLYAAIPLGPRVIAAVGLIDVRLRLPRLDVAFVDL